MSAQPKTSKFICIGKNNRIDPDRADMWGWNKTDPLSGYAEKLRDALEKRAEYRTWGRGSRPTLPRLPVMYYLTLHADESGKQIVKRVDLDRYQKEQCLGLKRNGPVRSKTMTGDSSRARVIGCLASDIRSSDEVDPFRTFIPEGMSEGMPLPPTGYPVDVCLEDKFADFIKNRGVQPPTEASYDGVDGTTEKSWAFLKSWLPMAQKELGMRGYDQGENQDIVNLISNDKPLSKAMTGTLFEWKNSSRRWVMRDDSRWSLRSISERMDNILENGSDDKKRQVGLLVPIIDAMQKCQDDPNCNFSQVMNKRMPRLQIH